MSQRLASVERAITEFNPEELREFSAWFAEFEHQVWDREIEADSAAGRLDFLHEEVQRERSAGTLRDL